MAPPPGKKDVHPPEKVRHTQNLDDVLTDALAKWNPGDSTEMIIRFEATIAPNPGGVSQYRCRLVPMTSD